MVNFSSLVLAPAMGVFGKQVVILPVASNPVGAPYMATGVWTMTQTDIITEDGGTFSSVSLKLGVRLADFLVVPKQGDHVTTTVEALPLGYWQGDIDPNLTLEFLIDDFNPDGQGGAVMKLKRWVRPSP